MSEYIEGGICPNCLSTPHNPNCDWRQDRLLAKTRDQQATIDKQQEQLGVLREALDYVYRDCKARAVDGVVPLGAGRWDMVKAALGDDDE